MFRETNREIGIALSRRGQLVMCLHNLVADVSHSGHVHKFASASCLARVDSGGGRASVRKTCPALWMAFSRPDRSGSERSLLLHQDSSRSVRCCI